MFGIVDEQAYALLEGGGFGMAILRRSVQMCLGFAAVLVCTALYAANLNAPEDPVRDLLLKHKELVTYWGVDQVVFVQAQPAPLDSLGLEDSRLVTYAAEVYVTPEYAQRRINYLKRELARQERVSRNEPAFAAMLAEERKSILWSIERMAAGKWVVQGTALVTHTPTGWKLAGSSRIGANLVAWILDWRFRPGDTYGP